MEQSLPIAANLLYQQASIVADAVLAEQRRTGSVPDVPADFQKKFYTFLDRINGHLMEDKDNFFGYFLFQMVEEIRFDMASPTGTNLKGEAVPPLFQSHALPAPVDGTDGEHD